jgi:uncharacterized protein (DUF302 family)
MPTADPDGVVTLRVGASVDNLLRRAVTHIEALGLDVIAVIDHSGDAAEAGVTIPDTKLVIFGSPRVVLELLIAHPGLTHDLPLKLLLTESGDGQSLVSYLTPAHLARRYGLTGDEAEALRVIEDIAAATSSTQ